MRLKYVPIDGFPAAAPVINHSAGKPVQLRGSNETVIREARRAGRI